MKKLAGLVSKLFYLLILLVGVTFVVLWIWQQRVERAIYYLPRIELGNAIPVNTTLLLLVPGVLLSLLALVKLFTEGAARAKQRSISYPGTYGNVVILLDSVEANLNRVIGKLREVKSIHVTVIPDQEHCKARVEAEVKLLKGVGESARATANRVSDRLAETAANLLGVDEVTRVDMTVWGIGLLDDAGSTAAPKPAPAPVAATAPVAPEPVVEPEREEPAPVAPCCCAAPEASEAEAIEETEPPECVAPCCCSEASEPAMAEPEREPVEVEEEGAGEEDEEAGGIVVDADFQGAEGEPEGESWDTSNLPEESCDERRDDFEG